MTIFLTYSIVIQVRIEDKSKVQARKEEFLIINDWFLIHKMRQGDNEALDDFVRKYYEDILKYCLYHCPDKEYARDLTQETFARFFGNLMNYHHKGKAKNLLYTIAANLCRDFNKKMKDLYKEDMDSIANFIGNETESDSLTNRLLIDQLLTKLPDELREVLTLYYINDLKLKEISELLNIGLPLVKYRLKQAKNKMADMLEQEEQHER